MKQDHNQPPQREPNDKKAEKPKVDKTALAISKKEKEKALSTNQPIYKDATH